MEEPIKSVSVDKYKENHKRKKPGRDKESRMKDLSDEESSGDSDSTVDKEKAIPVKSFKGHRSKTEVKGRESKSTRDTRKSTGKKGSSRYRSPDKQEKRGSKDKRRRDSSGSSLWSSDDSSQTREVKRKNRRREKELKEAILKRMMAKMRDPPNVEVSIEKKKHECSTNDELLENSPNLESNNESALVRKSRDRNKTEIRRGVPKEKSKDKYRASSGDVEKETKSKKKIHDSSDSSSSSVSNKESSHTRESKNESQMKEEKLKEAILRRMRAKNKEPITSIKVSIERKKYEIQSQADETQKRSSSDNMSVDADPQEQSAKGMSSKTDKPLEDVSVSFEVKKEIVEGNLPQAEKSLDIKKEMSSEKEAKREKSNSMSPLRSNDSSPKESKVKNVDDNKAFLSEITKKKNRDLYLAPNQGSNNERELKYARRSESSNSSSDSRSSVPSPKRTRRSSKKSGREVGKTKRKEKSHKKRKPSEDSRGKFSCKWRDGRRGAKERESSVSSTSSSSSKSMSGSSSSTSGSSGSSSSSRSSSASKERSSSSSSSSTTSSSARRHKRSFKGKASAKNRSRSPLNARKKSPPRPKKIHVGHLSKNINKLHLMEIFSLYGFVKNIDLPLDRTNGHTSRGFAYVEFNCAHEAENALRHMDGGMIDGQKVVVAPVLLYKPRPMIPLRRMSPNRRPFVHWHTYPVFRNRGGGAMMNNGGRDVRRRMRSPPRRRSPRRRTRSRSPNRRHRVRHRSASSSH